MDGATRNPLSSADADRAPTGLAPDGLQSGVVEVPVNAPEAMWDGLPRQIMMWLDFPLPTSRALFRHLKACGYEAPAWMHEQGELKALDHVPSKGTRCVLVYRAMIENWIAHSKALGKEA